MGRSIHHPLGLVYYAPQNCYRGYTLIATVGGDHATLVDMEGRVCHRWHSDEGIGHAYLLPNGNLLCSVSPPKDVALVKRLGGSMAALLELDWESNVVWHYRNPMLHHDYERLPNGNTLVLLWEEMPSDLSAQVKGGYISDEDPERMLGDVVWEITPDGKVVYEWRAWKHLDIEEDIICPLESRREWTHCNTVNVTPDGNLLVSFRRTSVVGIVERVSGDFRWKWGQGVISHQHHPTYLDNGRILKFDNGSHRRNNDYSRVIEVDPHSNEIVWEFKGEPLSSFYSFQISSAERLPNGNTLICEGASGRVFEVTESKELIWEYVNPFFFHHELLGGLTNGTYRAYRYGPHHPALQGRDLNPKRYDNLNRLYNGR